ncbi:hypothetical protein [Tissierella praeacuta]|uniref:hypothetical protein n=1 Tax=Tissierella praeacuta TaxID=43131 RepID=UPI00333F5C25
MKIIKKIIVIVIMLTILPFNNVYAKENFMEATIAIDNVNGIESSNIEELFNEIARDDSSC